MKYYNILLILLIDVVRNVFSDQTCSSTDFGNFNTCINKTVHQAFNKTIIDGVKEKIEQCVAEAHCTDDEHKKSQSTNVDSSMSFGIGNIDGKTAEDYKNCFLKVIKDAASVVENCVRQTYPGFSAPNLGDYQDMMGGNDKNVIMEKIKRAFTSCKPDQFIGLLKCVRTVAEESGVSENSMVQICGQIKTCTDAIPCGFANIRSTVCSCANYHLNPTTGTVNPFEDQFFICMGQEPPTRRRRQSLAVFVHKAIDHICTQNPCFDNVPQEQQLSGH